MRRLMLGIVLSALVPGLALAQTAKDSWDNVKQLHAGQKIQVVDMDLKSYKGTFVAVSDEAISLRMKSDEVTVEREDVFRVTDRGRSKRLRNVLIGAAIGAGAGLVAGEVWSRKAQPIAKYRGEYRAMGLLLVPIGAGAGAGVGSAFPGFRTIYRAEARRGSQEQ